MVLKAVGGTLIVLGTMWALQGLGVLSWPPQSFMLAQREWAFYGAITALLGAGLIWLGLRRTARRGG